MTLYSRAITFFLVSLLFNSFRPGPGEYFGEVELMRDSESIATVRSVADAPVEVVALDRQTFSELLAESEETRDAMLQIVDAR